MYGSPLRNPERTASSVNLKITLRSTEINADEVEVSITISECFNNGMGRRQGAILRRIRPSLSTLMTGGRRERSRAMEREHKKNRRVHPIFGLECLKPEWRQQVRLIRRATIHYIVLSTKDSRLQQIIAWCNQSQGLHLGLHLHKRSCSNPFWMNRPWS